jgi:signal transduction histidine kinase
MLAMLDASVASVRRIAADLRPLVLDDLGLLPAIEWLTQNFTQRHSVPCTLHMPTKTWSWHEPYATAVFRIVQESLTNVAKHAGASQVVVQVSPVKATSLLLSVADNGAGFQDGTTPRKAGSLGLAGLRERAQLLKGTVKHHQRAGAGHGGGGAHSGAGAGHAP